MATRVLGIDSSTNSIAFCLMSDKKPIQWGEITFHGSSVYERILDAKRKVRAIKSKLKYDIICIEAAVSVKSVATGLKMAYMFGTIMGELMDDDTKVIEVHPITWQSYIGNTNFTKAKKEAVKAEFPGKSDTWIKAKIRERRKQITLDFARKLGVEVQSDNVSDATGIAWWASNEAL